MKDLKQKIAESEAKIKILTRELEKKHGKLYHAIDVIAEKDKEIARLKEELAWFKKDIHHNEELQSNSRDFWKAEAIRLKGIMQKSDQFRVDMVEENIRLKKEKEDLKKIDTKDCCVKPPTSECACYYKGRDEALSELRDEIENEIKIAERHVSNADNANTLGFWHRRIAVFNEVLKAIDSRRTA